MQSIPLILAGISAAATVAGTVITMGANRQDNSAIIQANNFNQKIAEDNARIAQNQAAQQEMRQRRETRLRLASMENAIGGSGFDSGTGFGSLIADSAIEGELDALQIRRDGQLRARNFLNEANLHYQNSLNQNASLPARQAGTLLTGVSKVANTASRIDFG